MQSNNPAIRNSPFAGQQYADFRGGQGTVTTAPDASLPQGYQQPAPPPERALTMDDVVVRTALSLGILVVTATIAWFANSPLLYWAFLPGAILGLVIAFKQISNPIATLSYAALQGLMLGTISLWFETIYPGIVVQAVVGTFMVFTAMLLFYRTGRFRMTPRNTKILLISLAAVLGLMLFNLIFMLITGEVSALRDGGPIAIIFSLVVIGVGAFVLLMDFDMIDNGIKQGIPEKWGWYAAFSLTLTLIWLYIEILRLLSYFRE